jgi:two-component sensor histidine kinase
LQAVSVGDPELSERLSEASIRISTVGRAYDRLAYNADYEKIDLIGYLREVLKDLEPSVSPSIIRFEASPGAVQFAADRAILVALIANELVSNAGKYAYPKRPGETIWVEVTQPDDSKLSISVRDGGVGLPPGFDPQKSKRLGARLVTALSSQLGAELKWPSANEAGATFVLVVPLERTAD